ncbi:MAG: redoxin domain-containing protein [Pirellulaceae bacterium]|nr:redoxin domain-containing protein [Pirellulaceae bacterium]
MSKRRTMLGWMAVAGLLLSACWGLRPDGTAQAEAPASPIGKRIESFTLPDIYGRKHSLADLEQPLVAIVFLGTECPLARLYAPRLEALRQRFEQRGVALLAVGSNSQDSLTELAAFAQRHQLRFPVLKDPGNRVADLCGAVRTPEVFVLDRQRIVRYWGRIDDQYGVGYARPQPQREDLAEALEDLLAGREVATPTTPAVGCHIGRVKTRPAQGEVTYSRQIAAIFNRRCVECHRAGQIAPFTLTSYDDTQGWGDTIVEVIRENRMPPWHASPDHGQFRNDARLTDEEKSLVYRWVENGMPEGDPNDLPEPPRFADGWRMPEPDQVVHMSDQPFTVPAEGVVDYQHFEVDPGFTEDKYLWAAEARPDNPAVVHHILVFIKPPGEEDFRKFGAIDGYAPGSPPTIYRDGAALRIPAGSKFVFEMHYTPNGSVQQDRSYVGFKFLAPDQVRTRVHQTLAANNDFRIPPEADDYQVTARQTIDRDVLLLDLTPHMHVRGKSFRYEAVYPDGTREVLLDVPRFDFNWQLTYELAEPKRLPRGTEIVCTAVFDNSEQNLANPDPSREVVWGDQTTDEMMIGFFTVIPAGRR